MTHGLNSFRTFVRTVLTFIPRASKFSYDDPPWGGCRCITTLSKPINRILSDRKTNDSLVMRLFFFFFLERAWLVGSAGPTGGTIVHTGWGSTGSSRCELQYNKRWKLWRQNALENAGQHHNSLVNGKKQRRTISPITMRRSFTPPAPRWQYNKGSVNWFLLIKPSVIILSQMHQYFVCCRGL